MWIFFLPTTTVVTIALSLYFWIGILFWRVFFSISYKISPSSNMQQFYSLFFLFVYYVNNVLTLTNIKEIYPPYFFYDKLFFKCMYMFSTHLFSPNENWKVATLSIFNFYLIPIMIYDANIFRFIFLKYIFNVFSVVLPVFAIDKNIFLDSCPLLSYNCNLEENAHIVLLAV